MLAQRGHMPCLDGLRGLAALMVVLGHAPMFGGADLLGRDANSYGVLVFFVLSGFLIGHIYLPRDPAPGAVVAYLRARAARIAPLYVLVVVASFAASLAFGTGFVYGLTPPAFLRAMVFTSGVAVFWSIGPEVQFYGLFVALWAVRARLGAAAFAAAALAASAACLLTIDRWPGVLVLSKLHVFCCGLLLAVLRPRAEALLGRVGIHLAQVAALAILAALALDDALLPFLKRCAFDRAADPAYACFFGDVGRLALVGFAVLSCSFRGPLAEAVLANPAARALGLCSFSVYLLHEPVFEALGAVGVAGALGPLGFTLAGCAATVLASFASYRLIEAPARAFLTDARPARGFRLALAPAASRAA